MTDEIKEPATHAEKILKIATMLTKRLCFVLDKNPKMLEIDGFMLAGANGSDIHVAALNMSQEEMSDIINALATCQQTYISGAVTAGDTVIRDLRAIMERQGENESLWEGEPTPAAVELLKLHVLLDRLFSQL